MEYEYDCRGIVALSGQGIQFLKPETVDPVLAEMDQLIEAAKTLVEKKQVVIARNPSRP
jgi:translation elongation factor P/translation initiation factor 5A